MLNLKFLSLAITMLLFLVSGLWPVQATQYPLKVSVGGRHLEDQAGQSFLINGDTPWSLIVGLTKAEAEIYLEDRRSRGFNSIIVNLIEHKFGGPYNRDGEYPFLSSGDFSQPNEAYFQHADWVVNKATEKGLLIILTPAYIGNNCSDEGWCQEMLATSLANLKGYGNYLGNRYKNYDNIIWMHGGDEAAGDFGALDHVKAIADGIHEIDPGKLYTAHGSHLRSSIESYNEIGLDINSTYSYCDWAASEIKSDYERSPTIPFFFAEGRYEGESGYDQCLRSQAYWSVLGGSIGHFLGNRPIWLFDTGWQQALGSPGSNNMTHFGKLFTSRPWSKLVPDYAEVVVSGNRNSINAIKYIMAAHAIDGSFIMAYFPEGGTVTVDMSSISGSAANVWWFNPENGTSQYVGSFPTNGKQNFSSPHFIDWIHPKLSYFTDWIKPDLSDWVLIVDNADLGFKPPGGI